MVLKNCFLIYDIAVKTVYMFRVKYYRSIFPRTYVQLRQLGFSIRARCKLP